MIAYAQPALHRTRHVITDAYRGAAVSDETFRPAYDELVFARFDGEPFGECELVTSIQLLF